MPTEIKWDNQWCDFCQTKTKAEYDAQTKTGQWAFMCESCFKVHGSGRGLGMGLGQKLVDNPVKPKAMSLEQALRSSMLDEDINTADGCLVELDGTCPHGFQSPLVEHGLM